MLSHSTTKIFGNQTLVGPTTAARALSTVININNHDAVDVVEMKMEVDIRYELGNL